MNKLRNWVDHRTGYRQLHFRLLYERIPGGAKWRYVWGSTLAFTFFIQVVTGFFLWTAYSPSAHTAWESVYYIQYHIQWGWFVRGLHYYASHVMIVLVLLHLLQVVLAGAYRAPREVNWWFGLLLMFIVLALSLTGYLLPWDEKGYWATQVATKILGVVPIVGGPFQRLLVGGPDYGHHTLTRFFALHAGLLPALLVVLLAAHVALFRRHGVTHPKNPKGETTFWPEQALRDIIASLAVLLILIGLVVWKGGDKGFVLGPDAGASLGAPADSSEPYSAVRPEWYFLFLFQLLKYFPGETEVVGAVILPSFGLILLFLLPYLGILRKGHALAVALVVVLLGSAGLLTLKALQEDRFDLAYQRALVLAEKKTQRVLQLANERGIPRAGGVELLRRDPFTQGPILFRNHCAGCHRWNGHDGTGVRLVEFRGGKQVVVPPSASDLAGFGTEKWIKEFLKNPSDPRFFGHTKHKSGAMAKWADKNLQLMSEEEINAVAAFVAAQSGRKPASSLNEDLITRGAEVFAFGSWQGAQPCGDCHRIEHPESPTTGGLIPAPDLSGYASEAWLLGLIEDPSQSKYYGARNDRMPKFSERLTTQQLSLLIAWMSAESRSF